MVFTTVKLLLNIPPPLLPPLLLPEWKSSNNNTIHNNTSRRKKITQGWMPKLPAKQGTPLLVCYSLSIRLGALYWKMLHNNCQRSSSSFVAFVSERTCLHIKYSFSFPSPFSPSRYISQLPIKIAHLTVCDVFSVFDFTIFLYIFSCVINLLWTRLAQNCNGRISFPGLFFTDLTVLCLYSRSRPLAHILSERPSHLVNEIYMS